MTEPDQEGGPAVFSPRHHVFIISQFIFPDNKQCPRNHKKNGCFTTTSACPDEEVTEPPESAYSESLQVLGVQEVGTSVKILRSSRIFSRHCSSKMCIGHIL